MESQKILVDTDVLIDFLRRKAGAKEQLEAASRNGDLSVSVVTLAEILAGMRPDEKEATEELIAGLSLVSVSEAIARKAGELRRDQKRVLLPDCLIAATALIEECLLLTGNRRDYPFAGLKFFQPRLSSE